MIQETTNFTIMAENNITSGQYSIKQENLAHIFDILRTRLYSDKILAVIREYSTNAIDANVENGNSHIPIAITLPNAIDPVFKVRDFGKGLSEFDMFKTYSSYGASTKRQSNDYVGALGMGSKSAFGYSDSFTITSYHGGMKKIYEAYIDETKIGTIAKVHEEPSDEHSGICVTVSVKSKDISLFRDTAVKFFTWFDSIPRFFGINIQDEITSFFNTIKIYHKSKSCTLFKKSWETKAVFVKMGNIVYPVNDLSLIDASWLTYYDKLIINVDIGDVSFTTSRESLEMTEKTIATINSKMDSIKKEIALKWQSDIDSCATIWDALCYYYELDELPKNILENNLIWRNEKVDTSFMFLLQWKNFNERANQWQQTYAVRFTKDDKIAMIVDDGGYPVSQHRDRLMEARAILLKEQKWGRVLYGKGTISQSRKFLDMKETQGARIIKLSEVKQYVNIRPKSSYNKKDTVFQWNGKCCFPFSNCWNPNQVEPDVKKVYVNIDGYKPSVYTFDSLKNIKYHLSALGEEIEIYGVKKNAKLDSSWVHLDVYLAEMAKKIVADEEWLQTHKDVQTFNEIRNYNTITNNIAKGLYDDVVEKIACPTFKKIVKMPRNGRFDSVQYSNKLYILGCTKESLDEVRNEINLSITKIKQEIDYVTTTYPLLLDYNPYYNVAKEKANQQVTYVNLMHQALSSKTQSKAFVS